MPEILSLPRILVPPRTRTKWNKDVAHHTVLKMYQANSRAMVLKGWKRSIIRNTKILFVQSVKNKHWDFPGGGVEPNEDVVCAALRELKEEVGIHPHSLMDVLAHCFTGNFDSKRFPKDGYEKGKRYYVWLMRCREEPQIILQRTEVIDYHWCPVHRAEEFIGNLAQSEEKKKMMLTSLSVMHAVRNKIQ